MYSFTTPRVGAPRRREREVKRGAAPAKYRCACGRVQPAASPDGLPPEQRLEGGPVPARDVGHVAGVDSEQHLGGRVAHLAGDPFRVLARRQPQRGRRVTGLVGFAAREPEVPEHRMPHAPGHVAVVQGVAPRVAEDKRVVPRAFALLLEGPEHRLAHGDLALRMVVLGVGLAPHDERFAHEDPPALEIDVLPFEPVDFPRAHPREETHGVVGWKSFRTAFRNLRTSSRVNGSTLVRGTASGLMSRTGEENP